MKEAPNPKSSAMKSFTKRLACFVCNLVLNDNYEKACYSRVYEKSMLIYVLPVTSANPTAWTWQGSPNTRSSSRSQSLHINSYVRDVFLKTLLYVVKVSKSLYGTPLSEFFWITFYIYFTLYLSFVSDSFSTVQTGSLSVMFRGVRNQDKGVDWKVHWPINKHRCTDHMGPNQLMWPCFSSTSQPC